MATINRIVTSKKNCFSLSIPRPLTYSLNSIFIFIYNNNKAPPPPPPPTPILSFLTLDH
ncbi:hypothetical protein HanPI659440_Chr09g0319001 [Helianthus annuus]|nr:hypothetical protein HanPI659440_Chr09g0319001 [Helianthus annuus]